VAALEVAAMIRTSRLRNVLVLATLLGSGAAVAVAAPAWAVPGLTTVTVTSTVASDFNNGAAAVCPQGTKIVGGGADVLGGGHSVHLNAINPAPIGMPNTLWAYANEGPEGYAPVWSVRAWAICATGVIGWQMVLADAISAPGSSFVAATASCPSGKKVIGAGGRSPGKAADILDSINVAADLGSVSVEVARTNGEQAIAHAYAICVNPVPGLQRLEAHTPMASADTSLDLPCPAGTKAHSVGGGLTGAIGQAYIDELAPSGASLTGAHIDAREDVNGNPGSWRADLVVICAP
jgi:hypothetical protein